jgi:hypothetical protein
VSVSPALKVEAGSGLAILAAGGWLVAAAGAGSLPPPPPQAASQNGIKTKARRHRARSFLIGRFSFHNPKAVRAA